MGSNNSSHYVQPLNQLLQKLKVALGPEIVLVKVRKIKGISLTADNTIGNIREDPGLVSQQLVDQFNQLSPLLVNTLIKPYLASIRVP